MTIESEVVWICTPVHGSSHTHVQLNDTDTRQDSRSPSEDVAEDQLLGLPCPLPSQQKYTPFASNAAMVLQIRLFPEAGSVLDRYTSVASMGEMRSATDRQKLTQCYSSITPR